MTNLDLLVLGENIKQNLPQLKSLSGARFAYCLSKNIGIINKEIEHFTSIIQPTAEYLEYDKERIELCESFSKKDENGQSLVNTLPNGAKEFIIDIESPEWIEALNILKEKYKIVLSSRDLQIEEYNKFLQLESNVVFNTISIEEISNDITLELMDLITNFINPE